MLNPKSSSSVNTAILLSTSSPSSAVFSHDRTGLFQEEVGGFYVSLDN